MTKNEIAELAREVNAAIIRFTGRSIIEGGAVDDDQWGKTGVQVIEQAITEFIQRKGREVDHDYV